MGYFFCNRPDDHLREGRDDFERYGRYGYDFFKYNDHFNDCNRAYTDGFNEARIEECRREEQREEERREERRYEHKEANRRHWQREEEEAEYYAMYEPEQQEYPEQEQPIPPNPADDLSF